MPQTIYDVVINAARDLLRCPSVAVQRYCKAFLVSYDREYALRVAYDYIYFNDVYDLPKISTNLVGLVRVVEE